MEADKIIIIDGGQIVAMGNHERLLKNSRDIRRFIIRRRIGR